MASHITPFPRLADICLVLFLFRLWLYIVLFIDFRGLFPSLAHLHNAFLSGQGAQPLPGHYWVQTIAEFVESYKTIAEFTEW